VSIPRPENMTLYRLGDQNHADKLVQRYYDVIDDDEYLNFISKNAKNYYMENFTLHNSIKNTFDLLDLKEWL
jgi:hypothetical protein